MEVHTSGKIRSRNEKVLKFTTLGHVQKDWMFIVLCFDKPGSVPEVLKKVNLQSLCHTVAAKPSASLANAVNANSSSKRVQRTEKQISILIGFVTFAERVLNLSSR